MIISTYTEKEVLSELLSDYKVIKRMAKKHADRFLRKVQKGGRYIKETEYESCSIKTVLNNKWEVEFEYDQTKKIPWLFRACCIVEGHNKTKDYYILRGINTDKPYYVKVTSHALKRNKERNNLERFGISTNTLACWVFEHRETALSLRFVDIKFNQLLKNMVDADDIDNMSYIVLTNRGVYYALKTPEGNYVFKTYISTLMGFTEMMNYAKGIKTKWSKEGELLFHMFILHQYYNKHLYEKDILDNWLYSVIDKDEDFKMDDNSPLILLRN